MAAPMDPLSLMVMRGETYRKHRDYIAAVDAYQTAERRAVADHGRGHIKAARIRAMIGETLAESKDYRKATRPLRDAVAMFEAILMLRGWSGGAPSEASMVSVITPRANPEVMTPPSLTNDTVSQPPLRIGSAGSMPRSAGGGGDGGTPDLDCPIDPARLDEYWEVLSNLAWCYYSLGVSYPKFTRAHITTLKQAGRWYRRLIATADDDPGVKATNLFSLGGIYAMVGDYWMAQATFGEIATILEAHENSSTPLSGNPPSLKDVHKQQRIAAGRASRRTTARASATIVNAIRNYKRRKATLAKVVRLQEVGRGLRGRLQTAVLCPGGDYLLKKIILPHVIAAITPLEDAARVVLSDEESGAALELRVAAAQERRSIRHATEIAAAAAVEAAAEAERVRRLHSIADTLYQAMKGLGTDEDAIFATAARVSGVEEWEGVCGAFRASYPDFEGGDLIAALRDELSEADLKRVAAILRGVSVELLPAKSAGKNETEQPASAAEQQPAASSPADVEAHAATKIQAVHRGNQGRQAAHRVAAAREQQRAAQSIADTLHQAMKGLGTDEDAIFTAAARVSGPEEWEGVCEAFRASYADFDGGDLVAALRDELSDDDLKCVSKILRGVGVDLQAVDNANAKGRDSVDTENRAATKIQAVHRGNQGRQAANQVAAAREQQRAAQSIADALHQAMKGLGTDEDAIFTAAARVSGPEEWEGVCEAFRASYADFEGGDVVAALGDELSEDDFERVAAILRGVGVDILVTRRAATKCAVDEETRAATKIQALHRGNQGRQAANDARAARTAEEPAPDTKTTDDEERAATKIQALHRGNQGRQAAKDAREAKCGKTNEATEEGGGVSRTEEEERAATKIQAVHRGNQGRQTAREARVAETTEPQVDEERAATKIQALHRGNQGRQAAKDALDAKHTQAAAGASDDAAEDRAATKIQALHRGNQGRQAANDARAARTAEEPAPDTKTTDDEERAATKIQALHRGNKGRQAAEEAKEANAAHDKEDRAATKIQAVHRGNQGRQAANQVAAAREQQRAAQSIADALHQAMKGLGTDEDAIFTAAARVSGPEEWEGVCEAFRASYADFERGDMVAVLGDELSEDDFERVAAILRGVGVEVRAGNTSAPSAVGDEGPMDSQGGSSHAPPPPQSDHRPDDASARDMRGSGGMSENDASETTPRTHEDLAATKIQAVHRGNQGRHAASRAAAAREQQRAAQSIADALWNAMKGLGTDEDAIYAAAARVGGPEEWEGVCEAFRASYADFEGGDVVAALRDELSEEELTRVAAVLRGVGVDLLGAGGAAGSARDAVEPGGETEGRRCRDDEARAATKIQALHRGNQGRQAAQEARAAKATHEDETLAATNIQAPDRGNQGRQAANDARDANGDDDAEARAATKIQQGRQAAKDARVAKTAEEPAPDTKTTDDEERAATKIQALHRGNKGRQAAEEAKAAHEEEQRAATKIQALHRGNQGRQAAREAKCGKTDEATEEGGVSRTEEEERAATKIQAVHRGNQGRQTAREVRAKNEGVAQPSHTTGDGSGLIDEERAATRIQALHRGNQGRQAAEEAKAARLAYENETRAATRIQAVHRGNRGRQAAGEARAARVQGPVYTSDEDRAATKIQARHRGNKGRMEARIAKSVKGCEYGGYTEADKVAVVRIQARHRGNEGRRRAGGARAERDARLRGERSAVEEEESAGRAALKEAARSDMADLRIQVLQERRQHLYSGSTAGEGELPKSPMELLRAASMPLEDGAGDAGDVRADADAEPPADQASAPTAGVAKPPLDEHTAAVRIQAAQRGRAGRHAAAERREVVLAEKEALAYDIARHDAAVKIQAAQRGRVARTHAAERRVLHRRQNAAALRIQCTARQRQARNRARRRRAAREESRRLEKEYWRRHDAAVKIQAYQRGRVGRRQAKIRQEHVSRIRYVVTHEATDRQDAVGEAGAAWDAIVGAAAADRLRIGHAREQRRCGREEEGARRGVVEEYGAAVEVLGCHMREGAGRAGIVRAWFTRCVEMSVARHGEVFAYDVEQVHKVELAAREYIIAEWATKLFRLEGQALGGHTAIVTRRSLQPRPPAAAGAGSGNPRRRGGAAARNTSPVYTNIVSSEINCRTSVEAREVLEFSRFAWQYEKQLVQMATRAVRMSVAPRSL